MTGRLATPQFAWPLVGGALALHLWMVWPYTRLHGYDFDAIHLYFPLARGFLAQGLSFFAQEQSLQAPPFSYLYPALIGLDLDRLRMTNAASSGVTLLLAARTAQLACSWKAGVAAAFLFALSPLLRPFLATPITEPPYLLLCAAWVWALFEWFRGGARAYLFASAFFLVIAALTRATIFYWMIVLVIAFAAWWWRAPPAGHVRARAALVVYSAALLVPLALILKSTLLFGFGFYATGGGNALYLGNNPLTGGYDAPLLGLLFDVGSIARDQSHLTIEADRLLGGVARYIVTHESLAEMLAMHVNKLGAFLFVTVAEGGASGLRAWRIGLFLVAALGVRGIRHPGMRLALAGMVLYQIAVHIPVLYTHRYSVGALDLWLVVLAGVGLASLLSRQRIVAAISVATAVLLSIQGGRWLMKNGDRPQPDVFKAARILMWEGSPFTYVADPEGKPIELDVRHKSIPFDKSMNYVLVLQVEAPEALSAARCGALHAAYRRRPDADFSRPFERRIHGARDVETVQIGGRHLNLDDEGTARLAMKCESPSTLHFRRIAIYAPVGSIDFRERYLGEPPLFPGLMER